MDLKSVKYQLRFYFLISFACVSLLWGQAFWKEDYLTIGNHTFLSLTVVFHYFYLMNFSFHFPLRFRKELSWFFLGQTLLFCSIAIEEKNTHYLYWSFLPAILSTNQSSSWEEFKKSLKLMIFPFISMIVMNHKYNVAESMLFSLFVVFTLSTTYFSSRSLKRNFLGRILKLKDEKKNAIYDKERMFFHDLINQTHALTLFYNVKLSLGKGLTHEELNSLSSENKIIQSMVKDHFNLGHKNLRNAMNVVPFYEVKLGLAHLVENFLPSHLIDCKITYEGGIHPSMPHNLQSECMVYYPVFFRIMTNLIKNISEEGVREVELHLNYNDKGLYIKAKNLIMTLIDEKMELANALEEKILDERESISEDEDHGIGLESMMTLADEVGGYCRFKLDEPYWVTDIFLPNPHQKTELYSQKKAA